MPHPRSLPFKAVLFDLDGTLIISTIDFMKFRSKLLDYLSGKGANMGDYSMGETTVTMIARFEQEMKEKGASMEAVDSCLDEIDAFLNDIELEKIEGTKAYPGAKELLSLLIENGIKIGILTRGSPEYSKKALEISGLSGYVDAVVSRDRRSGIAPKPSAESAIALAQKLGVGLEETVMVGDFSIDFICAANSGIRFYGIASDEESMNSLVECGCNEIFDDLFRLREEFGL
jgi:HAD superfamily hydrolase (TIGR01549 family)